MVAAWHFDLSKSFSGADYARIMLNLMKTFWIWLYLAGIFISFSIIVVVSFACQRIFNPTFGPRR